MYIVASPRPLFLFALGGAGLAVVACSDEPAVPSLLPAEVDFGAVPVQARREQVVQIQNLGRGRLTVERVSVAQPLDEGLSFEFDRAGASLGGGEEVPIRVVFRPTEVGPRSGSLWIETVGEAGRDRQTLELPIRGVGAGPSLVVREGEVSFGEVVVGTTRTVDVMLTNDGAADATVTVIGREDVEPCGAAPRQVPFCVDFPEVSLSPVGRFELPARASTTVRLRYSPEIALGDGDEGVLAFRACDLGDGCEVTVELQGTALDRSLRCEPNEVRFGQVNPNTCVTRSVVCANATAGQVTVSSWRASEATSDDFTFAPSREVALEADDSVSIEATYCPTSLGEDEGALVIRTSLGPDVAVPVSGTGGGADVQVIPEAVDFEVATLIAPTRRTILVTNVGFAPLVITEISFDTNATGAFSALLPPGGGIGTSIPPGGDLELTIEFLPLSEGPVEGFLVLRTNDTSQPELRVRLTGEGIDLPPCQFELSPPTLDFGLVNRTSDRIRYFEVGNVGNVECLVTSVRMEPGSDSELTLVEGAERSVFIPVGAAKTFGVKFAPSAAAPFSGAVEVSLSAPPPQTFNRVALSGTGADATLLVAPLERDFGVRRVGCASEVQTVRIHAPDGGLATINDIRLAAGSSAFALARVPALPATLTAPQVLELDVRFGAGAVSEHAEAVEIQATFGGQPQTYVVGLRGAGGPEPQVDAFRAQPRTRVDVLFVIYHGGSTFDDRQAIAADIGAFLQVADAEGVDYRVAVTTADAGTEAGRICPLNAAPADRLITPNTRPDPVAALAGNINCFELSGGRPLAGWAFESARLAFSSPVVFGHNAGLLRRDAALALIFVADDDDRSARPVTFYRDFFTALKGPRERSRFIASALTGPRSQGCQGPRGRASAAPRFVEMAEQTGGSWVEICTSNMARALETLGLASFAARSTYFLSNEPVPSTIEVSIDGAMVPSVDALGIVRWRYRAAGNRVEFTPIGVPPAGSDIEVSYTTACR